MEAVDAGRDSPQSSTEFFSLRSEGEYETQIDADLRRFYFFVICVNLAHPKNA